MAFQPGVFGPSQTDAPTAASEPAVTKQPSSPKGGRRLGGAVVGIATAVADSADGPGDPRPGLSSGSHEPAAR